MSAPTIETPQAPAAPAPTPVRPRPGRLATASGVVRESQPPPPHVGHPLMAMSGAIAAGSMAHALHASPWWTLAITGPAVIAAPVVAHHRFTAGRAEAVLAAATTAAAGGWLSWTAATTPWSATSIGTLAAAATALGPVYGLLRWRRDAKGRREIAARAALRDQGKRSHWSAILAKAGAKAVRVKEGKTFRAGFSLELTLGPDSPDYRSLQGMLPAIERIAAHETGLPIRPGSIQLLRDEGMMAHQATLIVPTRDVLAELIELPDVHGPRSVADPLAEGQFVDGNEVAPIWRGYHCLVAGMTNYGKSSLLDCDLTQLVRCTDNVTFALAGNKAVRWLRPWLEPWLQGYAAVPPIDWVAPNVQEALLCLADVYRAIDGRQAMANNGATGWEATDEAPMITLLVDESPDLLESTKVIETHKGEKLTFSRLLVKVIRTARSEGIRLKLCTQRGTATMIGPDGGDLKSQAGSRYGYRSMGNMTDTNAVFSSNTTGIDLSTLPKGAFYIELEGMDRPHLAKGYWVSPKRISQYAIEATAYVGGLDQPTADLMKNYAGRWTRPGQVRFLEQVNGGPLRTELIQVLASMDPKVGAILQAAEGGDPGAQQLVQLAETMAGGTGPDDQGDRDGQEGEQPTDVYEAAGDYDASDVLASINAWADKQADQQDLAMLETMWDQPEITDNDRNAGAGGTGPATPVKPLPVDTVALLGVLHAAGVLYAGGGLRIDGEEYIPTVDVLALAVAELDWPNNPDGSRRVARALRAIDVESTRKGGQRISVYSVAELRAAAERHNAGGG